MSIESILLQTAFNRLDPGPGTDVAPSASLPREYLNQDRYEEPEAAKETYERAFPNPQICLFEDIDLKLAEIQAGQGRIFEAHEIPVKETSHWTLAQIAEAEGRFEEAVVQYGKFLEKKPDDLNGLVALGEAYGKAGDPFEAYFQLKTARQKAAGDPAGVSLLPKIDEALEKVRSSKEPSVVRQAHHERGIEAHHERVTGPKIQKFLTAGREAMKAKDYETAMRQFGEVIKINPHHGEARVQFLTARGDWADDILNNVSWPLEDDLAELDRVDRLEMPIRQLMDPDMVETGDNSTN